MFEKIDEEHNQPACRPFIEVANIGDGVKVKRKAGTGVALRERKSMGTIRHTTHENLYWSPFSGF